MNMKTLIAVTLMLLMASARADDVQVAAYYFPNWHRSAADAGKPLFGEWGNVDRAIPRFDGHQQPKRPLWGYEDEADPKVMEKKIAAAADHGVSAFIYCWYWHEPGPMLEKALTQGHFQAANRTRVPFALMWANHDVGRDRPGAVSRQVFDAMSDRIVRDCFSRPQYWRVDGGLYFSIYEIDTFIKGMGGMEQARAALDALRKRTADAGHGKVHLNIVDWQLKGKSNAADLLRKLGADSSTSYVWIHHIALKQFPSTEYRQVQDAYFKLCDEQWTKLGVPHFPNAMMGWDPTPRLRPEQKHTGKGYPDTPVVVGNTPERFAAALAEAKARAMKLPEKQRIITVYAWNEWSEGGYLEPDREHGLRYLEAIRALRPAAPAQP